jgi:hypothetical protein
VSLVSGQASVSTSTLATGSHVIHANYSGVPSINNPSTATLNVAVDGTAPVVSVTAPSSLFQVSSRTITARYSASDPISGVANYNIRYRAASWNGGFGGYAGLASHTTATSVSITGTVGREYCFSVQATDRSGNPSGWSAEHCTVLPVDDRSLSATTSGWTRATSSATWLSTVTKTTTTGAKLQLSGVHTNRIALVVIQCSSCASVGIYLNGVLWRTVSTYASSTHYKAILIQPMFSSGITTITLRNASTGRTLYIDGLGVAHALPAG